MNALNDFLDGEKLIGGITFRPFTIGSKAVCEQMGLTMFTTGESPASEGESERQLIAFAWLHSQPLLQVLAALRNGTAGDAAQAFGFTVPITSLPAIIEEINRISAATTAATVDVAQKPGASKDNAPGNCTGQDKSNP